MTELVVNGRFRRQRMTGIQRVAQAITARLQTPCAVIEPAHGGSGAVGHAWEQLILPARARGRPIWGPCNTGPLLSRNQFLTIHGAGVFDHPEWFSPGFVRLNHALWPTLAKRARRIITVSQFSRTRISDVLGVPKARIEVIWNGVDASFRPASPAAIASASAAVGLHGRPYFVSLATIEPRKNLQLVLRAWARARARLPAGMTLLVIGARGPSAVFAGSGVEQNIAQADVLFSGYVEESLLAPLLSGAAGVLYPSIYEGFGLPVLEAMACGSPAVTTRRTSLPEVGGDAALYVDAEDPEPLAKLLLQLASSEDLRAERRALGLERAKLFSWEHAAARMDALFARYA
jgi:glycosyltransferase involved in cell wall biosynthesis